MNDKQSESVKTLRPNSGYSVLRIVIDPSKDPRGPKMLFKPSAHFGNFSIAVCREFEDVFFRESLKQQKALQDQCALKFIPRFKVRAGNFDSTPSKIEQTV